MLLRQAIVLGAEYVDLEAEIAESITRYGNTKRIVSHHDFDGRRTTCRRFTKGVQCDPDIVKLVTMAQSPADNVRLLKLVQIQSADDRVLHGRPRPGQPRAVRQVRFAVHLCDVQQGRARTGQIAFDEMRTLYRVR